MSLNPTTVFLVQRIGPYHHARLQALAAARPAIVHAIEYRVGESEYIWESVSGDGGYGRFQAATRNELHDILDKLMPGVLVCVGYADREIHQAASWGLRKRVALIVCSDSTRDDEPRIWFKEAFKRGIIEAFGAALVAGRRAGEYMETLGMCNDRQFRPWDVVDNTHFNDGADLVRSRESDARSMHNLPSDFFLCVARFVAKKNLEFLIEAYRRYARIAGEKAWGLVLLGGGPLENVLRLQISRDRLGAKVQLRGALKYPDLPDVYGLAGAFILPSKSDQWGLAVNEAMAAGLPVLVSSHCGCAADLVREGENGFTFDPEDPDALAGRMGDIGAMDSELRAEMGRHSRKIIAEYSPEAFASGLEAAIECATARRPGRAPWQSRVLIGLVAARSPKNR